MPARKYSRRSLRPALFLCLLLIPVLLLPQLTQADPGSPPAATLSAEEAHNHADHNHGDHNHAATPAQNESLTNRIYLPLLANPAEPQTAEQLIRSAEESGEIDAETALIYRVYAAFDDPRLPAAYRGTTPTLHNSLALQDVSGAWNSLTPETQKLLTPFLFPPMYKGSWWHLRNAPATASSTELAQDDILTPDDLDLEQWAYVDTLNNKVRIWWQKRYPDDLKLALAYSSEIDNAIWPKLRNLMGRDVLADEKPLGGYYGDSPRTDIALVDIGRSQTTGTNLFQCNLNPAFILFNRKADKTELAHEMMHAFQLSFKMAQGCMDTEYRWLAEAVGEWAKDYVYPTENTEHHFAPSFLRSPFLPLDTRNDDHEYGAYLFPFYIARTYGAPVVAKMWSNTEQFNALEAVNAAIPGNFSKNWPEFVLHNWNGPLSPYDNYQKWDNMTRRALPWPDPPLLAPQPITLSASKPMIRYEMGQEIEHLSAKYYHMTFPDSSVRSFTFYNGMNFNLGEEEFMTGRFAANTLMWSPLDGGAQVGSNIFALVKIGGVWKKEDWTNQPYRNFCRDQRSERLEELVIIFSNSSHDPNNTLTAPNTPSTMLLTDIGCWRYKGTTNIKGNLPLLIGTISMKLTGVTSGSNVIWQRKPLQVEAHWSGGSYIAPTTFEPLSGNLSTDWSGSASCPGDGGTFRRAGTGVPTPAAGRDNLEVVAHSVGGGDHRGYRGEAYSESPVGVTATGCFEGMGDAGVIEEWFDIYVSGEQFVKPSGTLSGISISGFDENFRLESTWNFTPVVE